MQLDYVLQGFNVFIDGFGKAGSGEKITVPKLKKKTEDFRGGGMLGSRAVALGYETMEIEINLSAYDPQVIAKAAMFTAKELPISIRGYFDGDGNASHTGIIQCRGEFDEIDSGAWEAGKKAMLTAKGKLTFAKFTMDGTVVYEVDVLNSVYIFNGVDTFSPMRAALGF